MSMPFDITFHPSWWHKNAGIDFSQPFFDDPLYRIECDKAMRLHLYERFGELGLGEKAPNDRPLLGTDLLAAGYLHSELMGCSVLYQPDNSPQVVCRHLDPDQAATLTAPNLDRSEIWQRTQRQIDWLLARYGYVEPCVNLMGIQNVALDLMGQELFIAYYTDDASVRRLLAQIRALTIDIGKRFFALSNDICGGITAIVRKVDPHCYLTSNCSVEMISNDLYESFLLEHDQSLADAFGRLGIHHCGKTMEHVARGYSKVKNLSFAEVGAGSDLAFVRQALANVLLNARYSAVNLKTETEEQIHVNIFALYKAGRGNLGRFSISCVGIDSETPDRNIRAFLEACRQLT